MKPSYHKFEGFFKLKIINGTKNKIRTLRKRGYFEIQPV